MTQHLLDVAGAPDLMSEERPRPGATFSCRRYISLPLRHIDFDAERISLQIGFPLVFANPEEDPRS